MARRRTEPRTVPPVALRTTPRSGQPSRRSRRRGGFRGPLVLPGPLSPQAPAGVQDRRGEFDDLVLGLVERLVVRLPTELEHVDFGTEDVPRLPDDGGSWREPTPLGTAIPAEGTSRARIVVFRRPIELRTASRADRAALVHVVLVEQVAQLLGRRPDQIDENVGNEDGDGTGGEGTTGG